jgi:hypothetical protein
MRKLFTILTLFFLVPIAHAQGAAELFRSLTGALKGGESRQEKPTTSVMGVRGIDEEDGKKAAAPASDKDNLLMEGWAATRSAASHTAGIKGLVARQATIKTE